MVQAIGNEVIVAVSMMVLPILGLFIYYWKNIKQFYKSQFGQPNVVIQEPQQRQELRLYRNDNTCSICLREPKRFEVSASCSHSFCGQCIFQLYNREERLMIKCPLCRNQIHVLFKCFHHAAPYLQEEGQQITNKIKQYNMHFDDNRSIMRKIIELPYIFKRLVKSLFSLRFLVFFLRNIYFIRLIFMVLFYLLLPFDLIPENIVGIIGYIDDFLIFLLLSSYIIAIVAVQYYRRH